MSTRVAFPTFLGCKMSDFRRHQAQSPTPNEERAVQQAQVRRNLFGPIDRDENLKFVQNELAKIAEADCKKWNFDFEAEKPQDGRYTWERVVEGVPQAYEMRRLNYLSSNSEGGSTTATYTSTSPSQLASSSFASNIVTPSVPESSTTTTATTLQTIAMIKTAASSSSSSSSSTTDKPTFNTNQPSCSKDTKSSEQIRPVKKCNNSDSNLDSRTERSQTLSPSAVKNSRPKARSSQPQLTTYLKIRKAKRSANTKLEDDQPPALVKRPKTTSSS